jgi:hypothetical protein
MRRPDSKNVRKTCAAAAMIGVLAMGLGIMAPGEAAFAGNLTGKHQSNDRKVASQCPLHPTWFFTPWGFQKTYTTVCWY